jgi:hypothetical protein
MRDEQAQLHEVCIFGRRFAAGVFKASTRASPKPARRTRPYAPTRTVIIRQVSVRAGHGVDGVEGVEEGGQDGQDLALIQRGGCGREASTCAVFGEILNVARVGAVDADFDEVEDWGVVPVLGRCCRGE